MNILQEEFYSGETLKVAYDLLGKILIRNDNGKLIGGKIVETEAYTGILDKGAHVYGGKKTPRVMPLYGPPGNAYIYSIYGMYLCLNAITVKEGEPQGVLIRAVEPLIGLNYIAINRNNKSYVNLSSKEILNLTSGPSKLCIAFNIEKNLNDKLLFSENLCIVEPNNFIKELYEVNEENTGEIIKSKRVGIDYAEEAKDFLYRFYYNDNPYVSKKDKFPIKF